MSILWHRPTPPGTGRVPLSNLSTRPMLASGASRQLKPCVWQIQGEKDQGSTSMVQPALQGRVLTILRMDIQNPQEGWQAGAVLHTA